MRFKSLALLLVPVALTAWSLQPSPGEPLRATDKSPAQPVKDWQEDPVCRMVFFAVLEGLYEDGVPDDVVDSVVPRQPKDGDNPVKTSFVFQCPLCHPVYEAFTLYQKRPPFSGGGARRDTFGKGIESDLRTALLSRVARTRLGALKVLVQRWVERRLTAMRLSEAEKQEWAKNLAARSGQGKGELSKLITTDPNYRGWSIYWGCAACNGTTAACNAVKSAR